MVAASHAFGRGYSEQLEPKPVNKHQLSLQILNIVTSIPFGKRGVGFL